MTRNIIIGLALLLASTALVVLALSKYDGGPARAESETSAHASDAPPATQRTDEERLQQQRAEAAQQERERLREMARRLQEEEAATRDAQPAVPTAEPHDHDHDHADHDHEPISDEARGQITYITFEPRVMDFGKLMRGSVAKNTVRLVNVSTEIVTITRAVPTCVCTVPRLPLTMLKPGESVEVELEFDAKREGRNDVQVRFMFADGKGSQFLRIVAEVVPAIALEPATFDLAMSQDLIVTLRSEDRRPFRILSASPDVVVGMEETAQLEHTIIISAEQWKRLQHRPAFIRFFTDHPRSPSVLLRAGFNAAHDMQLRLANWANGNGAIGDLEQLIEEGVDVKLPDTRGMTALMNAANAGQPERLVLLAEEGIDLDARRTDGRTALMFAAAAGNAESVRRLIERGAAVNIADQFGRTALHWAARSGDAERVRLLLEAGARTEVIGPYDETPLMYAVKAMSADSVQLLLEAGANRAPRNQRGQTAHAQALAMQSSAPAADRERLAEVLRLLAD